MTASDKDLEVCCRELRRQLWRRSVEKSKKSASPLRVADALRYSGVNVHGIATSHRLKGNRLTRERCVSVFVTTKLPDKLLAPEERLPRELNGVPIDIVQALPAQFIGRTALAGESAAHESIMFGTLGWFCRWQAGHGPAEEVLALSANHVFADLGHGQKGEAIFQPSSGQGGTQPPIARLAKAVPLDRTGGNRVDAAVARLEDGVVPSAGIGTRDGPSAVAQAQKDDEVWKIGAASFETSGRVTSTDLHTSLFVPGSSGSVEPIAFEDLLLIRPAGGRPFAQPGDSGSLLVRKKDNRAVGIVIGRIWIEQDGRYYGVACNLERALDELKVDLFP